MLHAALLLPLLPLAGFVVLALAGRRIGDPLAGWLGTVAVAGSFVAGCVTFAGLLGRPAGPAREYVLHLFPWFGAGPLQVRVDLLVDPLSMTMVLFVTGISTLIHLYSIGYMRGDRDFSKFFLYLNLFVASMLLLVLGDNLILTFVGWEGVGACSYWLIAFWFGRDSAASAGQKAFIYNRIADVAFLVATFLVFAQTGTVAYGTAASPASGFLGQVASLPGSTKTAVALLLFVAAVGKSAQIPLFPWLADAMEGPTPVSALIHAATMVTAGVYLMCRIGPILSSSGPAQLVVATVGVATAFVAATIGCAQDDIKKVLAYSTVSQLGYMFLAVGVGAYESAIFLMVAHAFFKALLFLGAGSVIHSLHDEQDLKNMGNLRRYMAITFLTFSVGWLAIAGVPPLSGFFAKGDILTNAFGRFPALYAVGLVTAFLTAYYMTRLAALAFFGDDRWRTALLDRRQSASHGHSPEAEHGADRGHGGPVTAPHESPWVMTLPLIVLAVLAFAGGLLDFPGGLAHDPLNWLVPVFGHSLYVAHLSTATKWALGVADAVVAVVGVAVSMGLWRRQIFRPHLEPTVLQRAWYLDPIYDAVIGRPAQLFARISARFDDDVVDGGVRVAAGAARDSGRLLRLVQTGYVRQYALGIVLGTVVLLGVMVARAWV